jgi:hypothetical protein
VYTVIRKTIGSRNRSFKGSNNCLWIKLPRSRISSHNYAIHHISEEEILDLGSLIHKQLLLPLKLLFHVRLFKEDSVQEQSECAHDARGVFGPAPPEVTLGVYSRPAP